jgi:exodeoxyribonuclease VII large subunit
MCLLTERDLTKFYSLFDFVNTIKNTIKQNILPSWIIAEISEFKFYNNHLFLTLVEYDNNGNLLARARGIIWNYSQILKQFKQATNIDIKIGIKILALVTTDYHLQYGLTLSIKALDPTYSLGDAEAKLLKIKNQLLQENIFTNNKNLLLSEDFTKIAVISPKDAAGLGDFKKDALVLQNYNICDFDYYEAIFQGVETSSSIVAILTKIATQNYDAIVIIRGGGAVSDLTWLNDYFVAKAICLAKVPVFSGIGHNKDQTIIDQVSKQTFDTPSKVISFIINKIVTNKERISNDLNYIKQHWHNYYVNNTNNLTNLLESIKIYVRYGIDNLDQLLDANLQQILGFSPEKILAMGFSLVYGHNNVDTVLIKSKKMLKNYNKLTIKFHDGEAKL